MEELLTQNLTQNSKNADGPSGAKMAEKDMVPDKTDLESAQNACTPSLTAAHNPEVVGSSPTAATINPAISY